MSVDGLQTLLEAAPQPQRMVLRVALVLGRRPRGIALLARLPGAEQAVWSTLAFGHYDDVSVGRSLGWDAAVVAARGRELRRAEGRP